MSGKFLNLERLKECIGGSNPIAAKEIIQNVWSFFDNNLSKAELECAIETLFNAHNGSFIFLEKTNKVKIFKDCNIIFLELWIRIIKSYSKEVDLIPYVTRMLQICLKIIMSTAVSAKEKETSTIVLQEIYKNKLTKFIETKLLVEKLLPVFNLKTHPGRFIQQMHLLFGIIAKDYPENLSKEQETQIRDTYLRTLETTLLNEETIQFHPLTGALDGLDHFLNNFAPSTQESEINHRIYICMKKLSDPGEIKQKETFRASINLFTNHYYLFNKYIYDDYLYWHNCLLKWLSFSSFEDRRKGIFAICALHNSVGDTLINTNNDYNNILSFFINYFLSILESSTSQPHEIRIAIRGFGVMSEPCKQKIPSLWNLMVSLVIQKTDLLISLEDKSSQDKLEHFPDFIKALSIIINQIDDENIISNCLNTIENGSIRLIRDFHYLSRAHTKLVVNSLRKTFMNISQVNESLFNGILEKTILKGVILTCSHKLIYNATRDWNFDIDWKNNITYKSFLPFWEELLTKIDDLTEKIFDGMLTALLDILVKLDLRTKRRIFIDESGTDQEFYFCDPNIDLCPLKPKDFHIFFNIVDFYRNLFSGNINHNYFKKWIVEYCLKIMELAIQNPLISGFLKLLQIGLITANRIGFFVVESKEDKAFYQELAYFFQKLILKSKRISGELQISTIELILKYPIHFYKESLYELIEVFIMAFTIGKSYIWLAKLAVNTLDKMTEILYNNQDDLKKFYKKILPYLDSFLQSKSFFSITNDLDNAIQIYNKNYQKKKQYKHIKATELLELQKKIFSFIGKLDANNAAFLITKKSNESLVKWDINQIVRIKLNLPDIKPEIYLDNMMPRICHLAITSSDRKTKIAACEIVHTVVLYLLGTRNYKGTIWKELCSHILILGADSDTTIQEMFEPLLVQLMHFMSKPENLNNDIDILLNVLFDGLSNSTNTGVRDLSAGCLREFLEWSMKQRTSAELAASPVSIEIILEHLKMYSFDSNTSNRIGAAIAFNNLYRKLREDESICNMFFIDLLYTYCINFKLTEEFSTFQVFDNNPDLEQVTLSLNHIVRVLKERNDLFNKCDIKRKIPNELQNGTLKDVVNFLLQECTAKLLNYRRNCFKIIEILVVRIDKITSLSMFLKKHSNIYNIIEICEGNTYNKGIKYHPDLDHIKSSPLSPQTLIYSWLEVFLSSLDCYCWFINKKSIENYNELFNDSIIFNVIDYFLQKINGKSVFDILENINASIKCPTSDTILMEGIEQMHRINKIKCVIIIKIIEFITNILQLENGMNYLKDFWFNNLENMTKLIIQIIYEPNQLEFDLEPNSHQNIKLLIVKFLSQLKINPNCKIIFDSFQTKIMLITSEKFNYLTELSETIFKENYISKKIWDTVNGVHFVCEILKFLIINEGYEFLKLSSKIILQNLFNNIKIDIIDLKRIIKPNIEIKKFINEIMRICLMSDNHGIDMTGYILNRVELATFENDKKILHGEYFFDIYKTAILDQCNQTFIETFLPDLFNKVNITNFGQVANILLTLFEYLHKNQIVKDKILKQAFTIVITNLPTLMEKLNDSNYNNIFIKIMSTLAAVSPYPLNEFKNQLPTLESWIIERLKCETISLVDKSKLLYLLPLIIGPNDYEHNELNIALEMFQRNYFPLHIKEFLPNSIEEITFKTTFKSLLSVLTMSRSFIILNTIIKCTATEKKHILENIIYVELKFYIKSINIEQQLICLENIFNITCDNNLEPTIRCNILKRFLLTIIQNCTEDTVEQFYIKYIKKIKILTSSSYGFAKSGWNVEHGLIDRIIAFSLVENLTGCLPKEKIRNQNGAIGIALQGGVLNTGNELIGVFSKISYFARNDTFISDDKNAMEYFRLYQCAAYRALCSIVSNTQTELRFFSKFIFEENHKKNELIWQKLINCTNDNLYELSDQEFVEYPKLYEKFISIRKLNPKPQLNYNMTSKDFQTQNIFQSSLSLDISNIDLTNSKIRNDVEVLLKMNEMEQNTSSVYLEKNLINQHEVMPILCGIIKYMFTNEITPKPSLNIKPAYDWITAIANTLKNRNYHKNIRSFIAVLIDNCREVFQYYAYALFQPILEVLVDECFGSKLNPFITDLITLLLSWTSEGFYQPTTSEEFRLVSLLVKFLIKNAWHIKPKIFKYNCELISTLIGLWKNCITISSQLLLSLITINQNDLHKYECGLVMIGIIFNNNIIPWTENTKNNFICNIFPHLENDNANIYQAAAHVFGFVLNILSKEESQSDINKWQTKLEEILNKYKKQNEKKFRDILYEIHKSYSNIINNFKEIISFKIPSANESAKRIYLEMFLSKIEIYKEQNIFNVIISIGIEDILKNYKYQLIGLHIINRSLTFLTYNEVNEILPKIELVTVSKQDDCREVAYEILIFIVSTFHDDLANKAGSLLIKGLNDVNSNIRKRIFKFWTQESILPTNTLNKIYNLLSDFSINCEKEFLSFFTQLILESAIQNPDSKKQIFEFETDRDYKLFEYEINTNPRLKNYNTLPPLFIETQQDIRKNLLIGTQITNIIEDKTDKYIFEPTKDPFKMNEIKNTFTLRTQNSLPFGFDEHILDRRSKSIINSYENQHQNNDLNKSLNKLRNRFLKDEEKQKRDDTLKVIDYNERLKQKHLIEYKKKQNEIELFRRYRLGDYPDLLINSLAFLLPLQALIKLDNYIARQVFVAILNATIEALGPEAKMFITSIAHKVQGIFEQSTKFDPMLFSTFLEISLWKPEQFNFSPKLIANISKATNMSIMGIIYLENRLNADWPTDGISSKTTGISIEEQFWLYLSDTYNYIAEYDIVASIFSDKIKTDPKLTNAIEYKMNGDYKNAQKLLFEVITRNIETEHYYAYPCCFECIAEMGDWSFLERAVSSQIDNYEDLWTDDYNTKFVLPYLMQAELQNLLEFNTIDEEFLKTFQIWLLNPEKSDYIKRIFCEELMMLHFANTDFLQARVHCESFIKSFLNNWSLISSYNDKLRLRTLLNAQKVSEIDYYAELLTTNITTDKVNKINMKWEKYNIDLNDSLRFWNSNIVCKRYITGLISKAIGDTGENETQKLIETLYKLDLKFLNCVIYQKNFTLAKKVLDRTRPFAEKRGHYYKLQYEAATLKCLVFDDNYITSDYIEIMAQAWIKSKNLLKDQNINKNIDLSLEILELYKKIGENIMKNLSNENLSSELLRNLYRLTEKSQSNDIFQRVYDQIFWSLNKSQKILQILIISEDENTLNTKFISDSYYRIAQFYYDYHNNDKFIKQIEIEKNLISSIASGMIYGSKDARQLFASLLQLPSIENGQLADFFIDEFDRVPEWMFLAWIPQILSCLKFNETCYLDNIVKKISLAYRNAMLYPFNVWYDQCMIKTSNENITLRPEIIEIKGILKNSLADKFIENFKIFCIPEVFMLTHLLEFEKIFKLNAVTQSIYLNKLNEFYNLIYVKYEEYKGILYRNLLKYKQYFDVLKSFSINTNVEDIQQIINKIKQILIKCRLKYEDNILLENISPWLAKFQWCGEDISLELPGQNLNNNIPYKLNNNKIVKFSQKLQIFQTLRSPFRITIMASDGKNYNFLIKHGEDLKQDQRIQQILELMSEKLLEDENCKHHNLFIRTYKVIPIDLQSGILSWVNDTIDVEKFIITDNNHREKLKDALKMYKEFLNKPSQNNRNADKITIYGTAASTYKRNKVIANFRNVESIMEHGLIRNAFINVSVSPESFFVLRKNYATSLSAMSIAHYILGIGDRHLRNILINIKDGSLTGVDFNLTFGSGTRNLVIPELTPFRLTPQFINVMNPLGTSGIIFKCMSHSLRVFRKSEKILMSCMEVFVREPTVNWIDANKFKLFENENNFVQWEPKDRIDIASCKLKGFNPAHLFERELRVGAISRFPRFLEGYIKIIRGDEQFNIRARSSKSGLTVEEQTKCLVDIATDPFILGITFEGWMSWI